ncbi:MAG: OmpH family outer membrane protein [Blastocatellia bacterium]|nr:OmpH family outer membrane protein [Blastocatellia bacterium]
MKYLSWIMIGVALALWPTVALAQGVTASQSTTPVSSASPINLPTGRFAVINTGAFTGQNGIEQLKQQIDRVEEMFKDRKAELVALQQRADALQRELQVQGSNLTAAALEAKQEELENLQLDIQRKKEDFEKDYTKVLRDATDPVVGRINDFLTKYAKENNITLVLEAGVLYQVRGLAYVDPGLDITRMFIEAYNAAHPVTPGSPRPGTNR